MNAINYTRYSMLFNNKDLHYIFHKLLLMSIRLSCDVYTVGVKEGKGQDSN